MNLKLIRYFPWRTWHTFKSTSNQADSKWNVRTLSKENLNNNNIPLEARNYGVKYGKSEVLKLSLNSVELDFV